MKAVSVSVQQLLAIPYDGDIRVGAKHVVLLEELIGTYGNNNWRFVTMFFDVMTRHCPLLPFCNRRSSHQSA
ncbi:hypothetical protein D6858_02010 [Tsuneonella suprasediminis]|uniref:Uncharacterized protein n=1 Tax=Tsuneonella suprasediminis TaxID=2306996 RepID=A0A419R543_9SPHN|nr:hypothetical protein D6858_02010 [Tsuneonella suprasediminis]